MTVREFMLKKYPTNKWIDCPVPKHHWETIQEYADKYHEEKITNLNKYKTMNTEENNTKLPQSSLSYSFSFNERVVWDSHYGYEIGYFLGEGNQYHTYLIDVRTGLIHEPYSYSKSEINKYSNELIDELTKKYGYEKRFSNTF